MVAMKWLYHLFCRWRSGIANILLHEGELLLYGNSVMLSKVVVDVKMLVTGMELLIEVEVGSNTVTLLVESAVALDSEV